MQAIVDKDMCIGCGSCTAISPEVFTLDDDGKASGSEITDSNKDSAENAKNACPSGAISIE